MKPELRKRARKLRHDGKSVRDIEEELGCSKSSVSRWVKDVELTDEQILDLEMRGNRSRGVSNSDNARKIRKKYQDEGKEFAKKREFLHVIGCMLYWAEGAKNKIHLDFCNSDSNMVSLFVRFMKKYFPSTSIKLRINCYDDMHTVEEIEMYWLDTLGLGRESLNKTMVNRRPCSSSGSKKRKLEYGVCSVRVSSVAVIQHIFGAIQEYGGFQNGFCLD